MQSTSTPGWQELPSHVDVWQLQLERASVRANERQCLHWLTPDERVHHDQLPEGYPRDTFLAARMLRRATLSRYTGVSPSDWKFRAGRHGKPAVAAPAEFSTLRFNLTRTRGLIACAVTRAGEVGVDAEETSRPVDVDQVSNHFLSPAERACLERLPAAQRAIRFFDYWVAKEAYLKGRGTGLARAPEGFTIEWSDGGQPLPLGNWHLALHRAGVQHVVAVAVRAARRDATPPGVRWLDLRQLSEAGIAVE